MKSTVVQHNSWNTGAGTREQARMIEWRREGGWEMVEVKDGEQWEMEGELQGQSHLTLMEHTCASLKVCNLKIHMLGTYCSMLHENIKMQSGRCCNTTKMEIVSASGKPSF